MSDARDEGGAQRCKASAGRAPTQRPPRPRLFRPPPRPTPPHLVARVAVGAALPLARRRTHDRPVLGDRQRAAAAVLPRVDVGARAPVVRRAPAAGEDLVAAGGRSEGGGEGAGREIRGWGGLGVVVGPYRQNYSFHNTDQASNRRRAVPGRCQPRYSLHPKGLGHDKIGIGGGRAVGAGRRRRCQYRRRRCRRIKTGAGRGRAVCGGGRCCHVRTGPNWAIKILHEGWRAAPVQRLQVQVRKQRRPLRVCASESRKSDACTSPSGKSGRRFSSTAPQMQEQQL
jgi:hypothetical protein